MISERKNKKKRKNTVIAPEINRDWKIKWGEIPPYTPGDVGKN